MILYRIEQMNTEDGPYVSGDMDTDWDGPEHPTPFDDVGYDIDEGSEVCGFTSLAKLHRWFTPFILARLSECEWPYAIVMYSGVDESFVRQGVRQALFDPTEGKRTVLYRLNPGVALSGWEG